MNPMTILNHMTIMHDSIYNNFKINISNHGKSLSAQ